ncbi:TSPc domain-containing protein [Tenacibaculum sp. 190524A05c]|uniref:hypothetical protein n=1 Tax=Tenacibaculum platacis TaxID=3137852 RepID=UPI0031FB9686
MLKKLVLALIVLTFFNCKNNPNQNIQTEGLNRHEKWVFDINYFEKEFLNNAKTYTETSKDSCLVLLNSLKKNIDNLTDFQIRLELSKCVVLADNAHTEIVVPLLSQIPLRLYRFSDGLRVIRTDSMNAAYLGSKLLKINDLEIPKIEEKLFPYLSGIENWKRFKTRDCMLAPELLHALDLNKSKDSLKVTLLKDIDTIHLKLAAQKFNKDRYWFESWANLYPIESKENNWQFLKKETSNLPLYLKRAEEGVFYDFNATEKIAYFQINSFWDKCPNFKERVNTFNTKLKSKKDYDVVIDLRFYTGGNYAYAKKLATQPPKIINSDKKIYLVVSEKTYSAGIVTAARVKHFAKDKIVIVGEEVGDRLKFWAESVACVLPHSNIRAYNSMEEHDWKDNSKSIFRTHFPNFFHGVAAKNLNLDQEIQLSIEDYLQDKDPIMEWILTHK